MTCRTLTHRHADDWGRPMPTKALPSCYKQKHKCTSTRRIASIQWQHKYGKETNKSKTYRSEWDLWSQSKPIVPATSRNWMAFQRLSLFVYIWWKQSATLLLCAIVFLVFLELFHSHMRLQLFSIVYLVFWSWPPLFSIDSRFNAWCRLDYPSQQGRPSWAAFHLSLFSRHSSRRYLSNTDGKISATMLVFVRLGHRCSIRSWNSNRILELFFRIFFTKKIFDEKFNSSKICRSFYR